MGAGQGGAGDRGGEGQGRGGAGQGEGRASGQGPRAGAVIARRDNLPESEMAPQYSVWNS